MLLLKGEGVVVLDCVKKSYQASQILHKSKILRNFAGSEGSNSLVKTTTHS